MKPIALLLSALVLALGGAACGGDNNVPEGQGPQSGAPAGTEEETPSPATPDGEPPVEDQTEKQPATEDDEGSLPGGVVTIAMRNIQFDPKVADVKVGQTVRWQNFDSVKHDADATSGASFETELVGKGGTIEWTPEEPGTVQYICSIHPGMEGTLNVTE